MKNKKGFTLVEVISVVLVIAIILLVAIPAIYSHIRKGKEKINESNMTALELAAREYYSENRGELPNYNLYSLVLGTFLRDLNYLPDMSDSDGNNCDESYVVVENKNGEYIYHTCLICGGEKYKGNDAICNSDNIGPTDKCPSGQVCNPTCTIAPTKDAVGKWVKDVTFGVLGVANQTTSYPILSAKMYFDNKALTSSDYASGSKGAAKYTYSGVNSYFEYKLSKNGIYKMYENKVGDIGARVADMANKYSDICNYKNGTVLECNNKECEICIGNSCNKCTGSGCNPPSEDPTIKPDDSCDISTGTCTNPTEECNAGEICIDNKKPTCSITREGSTLKIIATDDLSGIKEIIDPSGKKMTKNAYDIVNATSKYVFTVRDRADNEGTCSYTSIGVSVKYDANGGTNAPKEQSTFAGETITITDKKPNRTNYEFIGWNTKKDGTGTSYKPGDKYKANQSITLYAQWRALDTQKPKCSIVVKSGTIGNKFKGVQWYKSPIKVDINYSDDVMVARIEYNLVGEEPSHIYNVSKKEGNVTIYDGLRNGKINAVAVDTSGKTAECTGNGTIGVDDYVSIFFKVNPNYKGHTYSINGDYGTAGGKYYIYNNWFKNNNATNNKHMYIFWTKTGDGEFQPINYECGSSGCDASSLQVRGCARSDHNQPNEIWYTGKVKGTWSNLYINKTYGATKDTTKNYYKYDYSICNNAGKCVKDYEPEQLTIEKFYNGNEDRNGGCDTH